MVSGSPPKCFGWIQLVETFRTIHNVKGFFGSLVKVSLARWMSGFTERSSELPLFVRPTVEHDHSGVWESTEMFRVDSARLYHSNDT